MSAVPTTKISDKEKLERLTGFVEDLRDFCCYSHVKMQATEALDYSTPQYRAARAVDNAGRKS